MPGILARVRDPRRLTPPMEIAPAVPDKEAPGFAVVVLAGSALIAAPFVNLLRSNDYPIFRMEVGIAVAAIVLVSAALAWLYRRQRPLGRALLESLLVVVAVDFVSDMPMLSAVLGLGAFLLAWAKKVSILPGAAMMGGVMLATTLVGVGEHRPWLQREAGAQPARGAAPADAPVILHLILDEHLGVEGFSDRDAAERQLGQEIRQFYLSRGFSVFGRAYSEYIHTANSVPHMMNYGTLTGEKEGQDHVELGSTAHLAELSRRGYRLNILQSDFADFCTGNAFASCTTYAYQSLRPTLSLPLSAAERAQLLLVRFATESNIAIVGDEAFRMARAKVPALAPVIPHLNLHLRSRTSTHSALDAFELLIDQVRHAQPGDAYLAHLLVPHFPYVVDEHCRPLPRSRWDSKESLTSRAERIDAYGDQIRCTMRKVDEVLAAASAAPGGDNLVVIVHGDHGSRIVRIYPYAGNEGRFADSDLISGYSTLFAVRSPGAPASYVEEPASVADLLRDFTQGGFRAPEADETEHSVALEDGNWQPRQRVPLPEGW